MLGGASMNKQAIKWHSHNGVSEKVSKQTSKRALAQWCEQKIHWLKVLEMRMKPDDFDTCVLFL